ncbi:MAG: hypothetical protein FJ033_10935 [Chloroflexi bacterium]|nr:hypothetical protein [Chloroflexota bacterium]
MSSTPLLWGVGDRLPKIQTTLTSAGVAVDLTGMTVAFKMRAIGSSVLKVNAAATIDVAASGQVSYSWASADVDTAGLYLAWWEVTSSGKVQSINETIIEIRAHAPATATLAELAEVRLALETDESDLAMDARILRALEVASELIPAEIERELVAVTDATRSRGIQGPWVDLCPWDLRTATTVTLDPGGDNRLLIAGQDYQLLPVGGSKIGGTYTDLMLSDYIVLDANSTFSKFGEVDLSIQGDWGFAAVPKVAREAAIACVRSWIRRSAPTSGYADPGFDRWPAPTAESTYAIPLSAKSLLRPLYRNIGV